MGKSSTSFSKGKTGNPGGRPKTRGLPELIASKTKDGAELVEHALLVMRGEMNIERTVINNTGEFVTTNDPPTFRDRKDARDFLANRLWGLPKAITEVAGADGGPLVIQVVSYPGDQT